MPKIKSPKEVQYLALEGGGGKGAAFLGAIEALESLGVLPIKPRQSNQVLGISGSSAGAITAMFLACGYDSKKLEKVLSDGKRFEAFFDTPSLGDRKIIDGKGHAIRLKDFPVGGLSRFLIEKGVDLQQTVRSFFRGPIINVIRDMLLKRLPKPAAELLRNDIKFLELINDGGFFCGFPAREFLAESLRTRFSSRNRCDPVTFKELFEYSGIDLKITGTNVSRRKPMIFSKTTTPNFPVDEAVGISMNLPFLFKPVEVMKSELWPKDYEGLWVDGGLLNNFPLHAFDEPNGLLNPNVLGLRLTDGEPDAIPNDISKPVECETRDGCGRKLVHKSMPIDLEFFPFLMDFLGALLFPSEEGQIRSESERSQTIELFTYKLDTLNFAPTKEQKMEAIPQARDSVIRYFKQ